MISGGPIIKRFTATARPVSQSLILDEHDIVINIVFVIIVAFMVGGWDIFQMKQILIRRDCVSYGHL